jgi:serine/threonine protein kinase
MNEIADLISEKNDPEEVFEILDVLGQGSYGSVSKALHKETGELYAIKILPATSGVEIASIKK